MESLSAWLVWAALAVIFGVSEIFTASFFLICFSGGAVAAMATSFLTASIGLQLLSFVIVSGALVIFSQRLSDSLVPDSPRKANIDRLVGMKGEIVETTDTAKGKGRALISGEVYLVLPEGDDVLQVGQAIAVTGVSGTRLLVNKVEQ